MRTRAEAGAKGAGVAATARLRRRGTLRRRSCRRSRPPQHALLIGAQPMTLASGYSHWPLATATGLWRRLAATEGGHATHSPVCRRNPVPAILAASWRNLEPALLAASWQNLEPLVLFARPLLCGRMHPTLMPALLRWCNARTGPPCQQPRRPRSTAPGPQPPPLPPPAYPWRLRGQAREKPRLWTPCSSTPGPPVACADK